MALLQVDQRDCPQKDCPWLICSEQDNLGDVIHQGPWLEWSSSGREGGVQLHGGKSVLEVPTDLPPIFLL